MPTHRTPHHFGPRAQPLKWCHSGACAARTRNPFIHRLCRLMDSGFSLREPGNDGWGYATISCNTFINASGAVTFGAWLASSSK